MSGTVNALPAPVNDSCERHRMSYSGVLRARSRAAAIACARRRLAISSPWHYRPHPFGPTRRQAHVFNLLFLFVSLSDRPGLPDMLHSPLVRDSCD